MDVAAEGAPRAPRERVAPVAVVDMDRERNQLIGEDGRRYAEVEPNTWTCVEDRSVVYLGTGRHGGGIVLRALYVRTERGWVNATVGRPAPACVRVP
ncbi:MAG: hypothetical protein Q4C41_08700 [Eggerthellaceae bacterium]|nr:hypothetical protein [Eggerthellaceae bacterium]